MKTKAQVKAMLAKIESTKGIIDGRAELIMALEWVLGESVSTSMSLETAVDGEDVPDDCDKCGLPSNALSHVGRDGYDFLCPTCIASKEKGQ